MRIAVGIVSLFPGGGLQRDCIEIVRIMRDSGCEVVIYTSRLTGTVTASDTPIVVIPNAAKTNHGRHRKFAIDFRRETSGSFDLIVGFDKLLGLDVLYCADRSFYYRLLRRPYLRLFSRYRAYSRIEGDSFKLGQKTQIILLSQKQWIEYRGAWHTEPERIAEIPSTLSYARRKPEYRSNGIRERMRMQFGFARNAWVWLAIGVQPRTKGLDRVLRALQQFPQARLVIAGLSDSDDASTTYVRMADRLGISSRITWLGHREDIAQVIAASDVLMHPARYDTTGTVILEAVVNGLPVITTSACGYAKHVQAGAGIVLGEPFDFRLFLTAIKDIIEPARPAVYSEAGAAYGSTKQLYMGRVRAAEIMLALAERGRLGGVEIPSVRSAFGSGKSESVVLASVIGRNLRRLDSTNN
jgi:UDP-glucose:(heptosyl)LPS alpha-1,3-glucosyltransferase